jgi:drug/metabolite transporter (DMT)-like permease
VNKRFAAPLFIFVASVAFATSGPLARLARPEPPLFAAFGRVVLAAAILLLIDLRGALGALRDLFRGLAPVAPRRAVLLGGVLLAAHFACFLGGIDTTSLPAAIALVSLEPLSVVIFAWLLHGDRPTRGEALGVLVATIGGFVVARGAGAGEHRLLGDVLVIVAVAFYGAYVAVVRRTRDALAAKHAAAFVYLVAAIVLLVAMVFAPITIVWPPPQRASLAIVGLAVIPTLIGHTAIQTASRYLSPATIALVSPGESVFGIAIAAFMMNARPTAVEAVGALVILLGATIAIVGQYPPASYGEGGTGSAQGGVTHAQR